MSDNLTIEDLIKSVESLNFDPPEMIIVPDRDFIAMRLMGIENKALVPASEFFNYEHKIKKK